MGNKEENKIQKLTIVGAGTSGAMAAAYLRKKLSSDIKISLIVPASNKVIGVGEATLPSIRFFMKSIGLKEKEWLPQVKGTYKCGIKFTDWGRSEGSYFHPFSREKDQKITNLGFEYGHNFEDVLSANLNGVKHEDFLNNTTLSKFISDYYLSPVSLSGKSYVSYAYHFDAELFAELLLKHAQGSGVEVIYDEVIGAKQYENGFIESLTLKSGIKHFSDFYVDCSGFKAKLFNDILKVPFVSYADKLFVDKAVAVDVKHDFGDKLPPYTESLATDSGWIWKIPLRTRIGAGKVYHSDLESKESALEKLGSALPGGVDSITNVKHLDMSVGRRKVSWEKNCISLGLSNSFIEPLESTSIGLTEYQIFLIKKLLPKNKFDTQSADFYNSSVSRCFDNAVDFVRLHYILSERNDSPFWRNIQEQKKSLDSQELIMQAEQFILSGFRSTNSYQMFNRFSYACIFTGLGRIINFERAELLSPKLRELLLQKRREMEGVKALVKKSSFLHSDLCQKETS